MARNVSVDSSEVQELERIFGTTAPKALKKAMRLSLTRTRSGAKSETSKKIREHYEIKAKRVKQDIVMTRVNFSSFQFSLIGRKKPISTISFGRPRQVRAGVSVTVEKGERKLIKRAFIARGLNGKTQVFSRFTEEGSLLPIRKMEQGRHVGERRRVIRGLKGPSASDMFKKADIEEHIAGFARDRFLSELQRNLRFLLGRT